MIVGGFYPGSYYLEYVTSVSPAFTGEAFGTVVMDGRCDMTVTMAANTQFFTIAMANRCEDLIALSAKTLNTTITID